MSPSRAQSRSTALTYAKVTSCPVASMAHVRLGLGAQRRPQLLARVVRYGAAGGACQHEAEHERLAGRIGEALAGLREARVEALHRGKAADGILADGERASV